jgi:hypothetical protein
MNIKINKLSIFSKAAAVRVSFFAFLLQPSEGTEARVEGLGRRKKGEVSHTGNQIFCC